MRLTDWLPTTLKEVQARGWNELDVILFSGDAYVDHPSFGSAVIGRVLEAEGLKVAIVPQPNWQDDLRDFKKLGKPRLFFGVSAGNMDSMVNHYTANKRRRSNDAYTAGGEASKRPDYATIVYSKILKELYPDVPVVIGGIEASLRRLTHYDYWQDKLMPSILIDSKADLLFYGMAEKSIVEYAQLLQKDIPTECLTNVPQTAFLIDADKNYATQKEWSVISLHSHEECLRDKKKYAENFKHIEEESNKMHGAKLMQMIGTSTIVVNPSYSTMSEVEIDRVYDLPYTRLPHPKYQKKAAIPAYDMIRHSINMHRGCFGGCSFCTISAHQGKFVASRSEQSILKEVEKVSEMHDFKGYISDLGGPSANMYKMKGVDEKICEKCKRPSCIFPSVCANLNNNHEPMTLLYRKVRNNPKIKKAFIGSGIRYDMILHQSKDEKQNQANINYMKEVIRHHVSGRLKVAPEHTSDEVLNMMRKPSFKLFHKMNSLFNEVNKKEGLKQQLIPYFISSHPGCTSIDMANLAAETKSLNFQLEQVQDLTPTPMTLSTVMYYSGYNPYTGKSIFTAKTQAEKLAQRKFFFWYKKEYQREIRNELMKMNRKDLLDKILGEVLVNSSRKNTSTSHRSDSRNDKKRDDFKREGKNRRG
ncbi:MAG: YgiQ family radical SAM protein [Mangrovibacterium sp.]